MEVKLREYAGIVHPLKPIIDSPSNEESSNRNTDSEVSEDSLDELETDGE